jgi:hypothetical protein
MVQKGSGGSQPPPLKPAKAEMVSGSALMLTLPAGNAFEQVAAAAYAQGIRGDRAVAGADLHDGERVRHRPERGGDRFLRRIEGDGAQPPDPEQAPPQAPKLDPLSGAAESMTVLLVKVAEQVPGRRCQGGSR